MRDSLFRMANGVNFINMWTTMNVKPEHAYRLADVQWVFYYKINSSGYMRERLFRKPRRDEVHVKGPNTYSVLLEEERDDPEILLPEGEIVESRITVFVASGGPEWNDQIASLDDLTYALPDGLSNVKNGVGYLVGIVSKTIPFECGG